MTESKVDEVGATDTGSLDRLIDKCDGALEQHRSAGVYDEAWALTQLELHRTRDLLTRQRAALAACTPAKSEGR